MKRRHQRLWVADDVRLNEAFASFVGEQGARQWFAVQGRSDEFAAHRQKAGAMAPAYRFAHAGQGPIGGASTPRPARPLRRSAGVPEKRPKRG